MAPTVFEPISLVLAADEAFAMPMATTVKSILLTLSPEQLMDVYVMDVGLSPLARQQILASWSDQRIKVIWLTPDLNLLKSLPVAGHLSRAVYARLLIGDLLPSSLEKIIYLDSDLLVLRDIKDLWQQPLNSAVCLAAQDIAAPWFDAEVTMSNYSRSAPYLAATRPIANYPQLGLPASSPYFNSGVLVIDLPKWRAKQVSARCLDCLVNFNEYALWLDQYALNVVLSGHWQPLDMRWNQGTQTYVYPSWEDSPLGKEPFKQLRSSPFIVHFTSSNKPWHLENRHPWRSRYYKVLDQTAWAGWRPASRMKELSFTANQYLMWIRRKLL